MTTTLDHDLTVRSLLFGKAEGPGGTPGLGEALTGRKVAATVLRAHRHLRGAVLGAVDHEIGDVAEDMLDIGVGEPLLHGWSKHAELNRAARRTLSTPGSEVVALATHEITSIYRPSVDLLVDGAAVGTVEFEVRLAFQITGLAAVLRAGSLVELRSGDILATASLLVNRDTVARRQRRLDPALVMRLDPSRVLAAPPSAH